MNTSYSKGSRFEKSIRILIIFLTVSINISAQTKTSNGSGNWNVATTWLPLGVPTATDDVLITGNDRVDIVSNSTCKSLTVGIGGGEQLRFNNTINLTFSVSGNIIVANNAQFRVRGSNATHTLFCSGDITNNGTINFYRSSNRNCELILTKNGNQNISGGGVLTQLHLIKLQMGASVNNIANFSTTDFTVNNDFLTLTSGTFKYSTASAINITPFNSAVTIPTNGGLWMNAATSQITLPSGVIVSGKLSNSIGTLNVGNSANETLLYASGTFSFTGGVTNIAGRFNGNSASSTCVFNMTGGSFNVPSVSTNNTTDAPFQIGTAGSTFNMSGGTILINREGGTGAQNLGYVNLAGSGTVNGGTLQIGSSTSPATQIYQINSTALIPNLILNNSTATAILLTNAITVTNTIKITLGTLNSNNLGITLGGDWLNNGGTFTPGTSTVTFNSSSAQSLFKSGGETFNHLLFTGSGTKTFVSPIIASSNFSIASGSSVDVSATNYLLTVKGNFMNSGTFNSRSGSVLLNGTTTQTIGGSSTTNFFDITLNNAAGAKLTQSENLVGALTLSLGTFSTNAQVFTMISTAAATARIAQITSGDISGNVKVQRFVPGGATGWALWGTPISSALTFNDWDDNIAISCPTCPDGYVANFPSIYSYDETVTGSYSNTAAYIALNTINDAIVPNKGYWVYVGDGQYTTNNITLDVTGTVRKGAQTINLTRTNTGSPADDGWNLIHNPYPSPISWALLRNANANVDNAIYCFNADLNGGSGASATYVNGVSSPAVGSGGIGDNIPMCQGFYVHVTNNTTLNGAESNKTAVNTAFLRPTNQSTINILRIAMNGGPYAFSEECVIYIDPASTTNFDDQYDAYKLVGQDIYVPYMALENGTERLQISAIPQVSGTYTTDLKTLTAYNGSYTISATEFDFPIGTCLKLFDKFTNTSTDLTASDYVFDLEDTTTVARFILSITLDPLQITSNMTQPTCSDVNGGKISAIGLSAGPWNYYWKDANGNPLQTSLNKITADTLQGLYNGGYQLDVTSIGQCDNNHSSYMIVQKINSLAGFSCLDTNYMNQGAVQFNNTSLNVFSQSWDFGDAIGTSTISSPQYAYQTSGNYLVKLITVSSTNCLDTVVKHVYISGKPVGINAITLNNELKVKTLNNNKYVIEKELNGTARSSYTLKDVEGRVVLSQNEAIVEKISLELDLSKYTNGIYFLDLLLDDKATKIKLIKK